MAKKPKGVSGSKLLNMISSLRGEIPGLSKEDSKGTSGPDRKRNDTDLISRETKTRILSKATEVAYGNKRRAVSPGMLSAFMQNTYVKTGKSRVENRQILELVPEVEQAARLLIASCFSPTDLARNEIQVVVESDEYPESVINDLNKELTKLFQARLNLKQEAPEMTYQFGYETGAVVYAVIPLSSFAEIEDRSFIGRESFSAVLDQLEAESLFDFGNTPQHSSEFIALETFGSGVIETHMSNYKTDDSRKPSKDKLQELSKAMVSKMMAMESISFSDNPNILQASQEADTRRTKAINKKLAGRYRDAGDRRDLRPTESFIVNVSDAKDEKVVGEPILMRLPAESVTIIHTPGDPSDHIGYLVLLDQHGNPVDATHPDVPTVARSVTYSGNQQNIFSQVYDAYGLTDRSRGISDNDTMSRIYTDILQEKIKHTFGKSILGNVDVSENPAMFRCMFGRFMEEKRTRILFLPKELVTYMTFEKDVNGYGVSLLERVKFLISLKMTVQISRVMAAIKNAMDNRKIDITLTDNEMSDVEQIMNEIMREYVAKSTITFSTDPTSIQTQIASKSATIHAKGIPGMEDFEISNEADPRSSDVNFSDDLSAYLDKAILNGMKTPPSALNSLDENEYSRSIATTNLFYSMNVSVLQEIIVSLLSKLIRDYGRYSTGVRAKIRDILPSEKNTKVKENSSTQDTNDHKSSVSEEDIDDILAKMKISLPHPNIAPSKAQFEALDAMVSSVGNLTDALLPDELVGADDTLSSSLHLIRAKLKSSNIRAFLETSGFTDIDMPESNFSKHLTPIINLVQGLGNIRDMLEAQAKLDKPDDPLGGSVGGSNQFGDTGEDGMSSGSDDPFGDDFGGDDASSQGGTDNPFDSNPPTDQNSPSSKTITSNNDSNPDNGDNNQNGY